MKAFFESHDITAVPAPPDAVLAWQGTADGDAGIDAWFDLGVALSTGSRGMACDLIEAHKWFNIAARSGHAASAQCRAELALEMTPREVADAQRRAREWLSKSGRT